MRIPIVVRHVVAFLFPALFTCALAACGGQDVTGADVGYMPDPDTDVGEPMDAEVGGFEDTETRQSSGCDAGAVFCCRIETGTLSDTVGGCTAEGRVCPEGFTQDCPSQDGE